MALVRVAAVALVVALASGNIFDEHRKKSGSRWRREQKRRGSKHRFKPKLPATEPEVAWRQSRINQSLARLDKFLGSMHTGHRSRNETFALRHDRNAFPGAVSFLETGSHAAAASQAQFAGGVAGAAMNMLFSRTTMCVMCSYILEMADRQVKASPRWANGGGGFFPGTVDFSPGENQGYYRTYPGGYLELDESVQRSGSKPPALETDADADVRPAVLLEQQQHVSAPVGSGAPEKPAFANQGDWVQDPSQMAESHGDPRLRNSGSNAMRMRATASITPGIDTSPRPQTDYSKANPKFGWGTTNGQNGPMKGNDKRIRVGRFTHRDFDRVDSQSEKSMEYQQMFKDLMDALDEICFKDLPSEYTNYCMMPFTNGEALVEYYLHDFEDWEICTKIYSCLKGFYDDI